MPANPVDYLKNLIKESKDVYKAYNRTGELSSRGSTYPPNDIAPKGKGREYYQQKANQSRDNVDAQWGQAFGALLQGKSYDNKTGKQIKDTKKGKK
jgi:hypothetical protein